jgi:hypothetical protein
LGPRTGAQFSSHAAAAAAGTDDFDDNDDDNDDDNAMAIVAMVTLHEFTRTPHTLYALPLIGWIAY